MLLKDEILQKINQQLKRLARIPDPEILERASVSQAYLELCKRYRPI